MPLQQQSDFRLIFEYNNSQTHEAVVQMLYPNPEYLHFFCIYSKSCSCTQDPVSLDPIRIVAGMQESAALATPARRGASGHITRSHRPSTVSKVTSNVTENVSRWPPLAAKVFGGAQCRQPALS